ncbi:hypothetical protein PGVV14_0016 [Preplasmiviricota sp. Gezel-14T]|nr:hypothetical protein PGVV14_0016 [Preplasmiviricota sp. Gezel-14T]
MKDLIHSAEGIRLEDFLKTHGSKLKHTRALYVVAPNMEKNKVYKFGIAGTNTGNAYQRLNEYVILYGENDKKNTCKGVLIHYCGTTEYNRLVLPEKSKVFQLELKLKQDLKATEGIAKGRGSERVLSVKTPITSLLKTISKLTRSIEERPIEITRVAKESTKKYRTDTKAFVEKKTEQISSRTRSKSGNLLGGVG